jgi:[ribosomal protein S5]-alanine N-acetyltransferase
VLALPTLDAPRLVLRPFAPADAADVQRMAGRREVSDTTLNIPHPYEDGVAERWIASHAEAAAAGERLTLAITLRETGELCGAITLHLRQGHARAELGYWVGVEHWSRGYCTEAARAMLAHAFDTLGLHRVHSTHLTRNPASGRVMQKLGMRHEGTLREHFRKWDRFEDVAVYGILASDAR